jgi:hypothetical protein
MESYDRGLADGMRTAAEVECTNCAEGRELYHGHPRDKQGFGREWRHEGHHCRCGAWRIWDDMVRRGLLEEPEGWRGTG